MHTLFSLAKHLVMTLALVLLTACGGGGSPSPSPTTYVLTYIAGAHGALSGTTSQTVKKGENGTAVTAAADTGYHFSSWSDASTSNPRIDTDIQSNLSVTANFEADAPSGTKLLSQINAGVDREVKKGTTITMAGTYEGNFSDVASYIWKEQNSVLSHSISFSYTPQSTGNHTLTLTIVDKNHNNYSDNITIHTLATGEAQANHTHHAKTAMLAYAKYNETVTLKGSYTGEADAGITYQWKEGDTPLSNQANFEYAPNSLGAHILTLTITDSQGFTDEALLTLFTVGGDTNKVVTLDTNGNTNNEIQINAALQEVADAGGGVVHLNAGTYVIERPIFFTGDNTILEGEDSENTIIQLKENVGWNILHRHNNYTAPKQETIISNTAEALHNLAMMNIQIDGNKYNQHYTYDVNGDGNISDDEHFPVPDGQGNYVAVDFQSRNGSENISNLLFSNVFIHRNNGDALALSNPTNVIVENCKSRYIGHSAVYFDNPITMLVEKNDFLITANSGVRWYDGNHIIVRDNLLQAESTKTGNSNCGVEVTSGLTPEVLDDVLIEGNIIRFTGAAGIAIDGKTPTTSRDMIIRNNIIAQCGHIGT